MFDAFYGFKATPFCRGIDACAIYRDPDRLEILKRLNYAANSRLFVVLTGDSGSGKTTLLRHFNSEISPSGFSVIYVSDHILTPRHFYKGILEQMGYEAKYHRGDALRQLHREVELLKAVHNISPVLIVDEAHLLKRDMLEEVRFLLNMSMDSQSPLALILAGQTELWEKLRLHSFTAIRQRVDILCHVAKLDRSGIADYISSHLAYAGCVKNIFSDAAIDEILKFSNGLPRLVNKAATAALFYGAQNQKNIIDDHMVKLVIDGELA